MAYGNRHKNTNPKKQLDCGFKQFRSGSIVDHPRKTIQIPSLLDLKYYYFDQSNEEFKIPTVKESKQYVWKDK